MFVGFLLACCGLQGAFGQVLLAFGPAPYIDLGPIITPYPAAIPIIMTFNKSIDFLNPTDLIDPRPRVLYNLILHCPLTHDRPRPEYKSEKLEESLSVAKSITSVIRIFVYDDGAVPDGLHMSLLEEYAEKNVAPLPRGYWEGPAIAKPLFMSYAVIILPDIFKAHPDYAKNIFASPEFFKFYMIQVAHEDQALEYAFIMFYQSLTDYELDDFEGESQLAVPWSFGAFVCVPCSDTQPPFHASLNFRQPFTKQPIQVLDAEDGVHLYVTLREAFSDTIQNGEFGYWIVKTLKDERLQQDGGTMDSFDRFKRPLQLEHSIISALLPIVNDSTFKRRIHFDTHPEPSSGQWLDRKHFIGAEPEVVYFAFGEPPSEPSGDLVSPFNFEVWISIPVAILGLSLFTTTMSLATTPGPKSPAVALRTLSASVKTFTVHLIDQSVDTSKSIIWQHKSRHVAMLLNVLLVSWIFVALLINNGYKSFAKATLGFRHQINFDARWPSFENYSLFHLVDQDKCTAEMDRIHMFSTFEPETKMFRGKRDAEVVVYFEDLQNKLQKCTSSTAGLNKTFVEKCKKQYAAFWKIMDNIDFICLKHLKLYTEKLFLEPLPEVPEWNLKNADIEAIRKTIIGWDQHLKYVDYEYAEAKYWNTRMKDKAFVVNDYMYERTWNELQKLMRNDSRVKYHHLNKLSSRFTSEKAGAPSFYLGLNIGFQNEQNAYVLDRAKYLVTSGILGFMEFWHRRWTRVPPANVTTNEDDQLRAQAMNLQNSDFGKIMGVLGAGLVFAGLTFVSEMIRIKRTKKLAGSSIDA